MIAAIVAVLAVAAGGAAVVPAGAATAAPCTTMPTVPKPPEHGVVLARRASPSEFDVIEVVQTNLSGPAVFGLSECGEDPDRQWAAVARNPEFVAVGKDAAIAFDFGGLLYSLWGAKNIESPDAGVDLFPGRRYPVPPLLYLDVLTQQAFWSKFHSCRDCQMAGWTIDGRGFGGTGESGFRHDLSGADLQGARLTGNFVKYNLSDAVLRNATVNGVDFSGANLSGADLEGARGVEPNPPDRSVQSNFSGADLKRAVLAGADLGWTNLKDADLRGADLENAYVDISDLDHANLSEANLTLANLRSDRAEAVNLTGTNLTGTDLSGAGLDRAVLDGSLVTGTDFGGASLRGAHVTSLRYGRPPRLEYVSVGESSGECTIFKDTDLVGINLLFSRPVNEGCRDTPLFPSSQLALNAAPLTSKADQGAISFDGAVLVADAGDRAALEGADLRGARLDDVRFVGFPANLERADFNDASLNGASFTVADLSGATFDHAKAVGASFQGGDLASGIDGTAGAQFAGADLTGADFVGADVSGASFRDADISGAAFNRALADGTSFVGVRAVDTSFEGAHIYGSGSAFQDASDLQGADFAGALLAGNPREGGLNFTLAKLSRAKFAGTQCIACDFAGASLAHVDFSGSDLPGVNFTNADLTSANLTDARLYCGDMQNASCEEQQDHWYWPVAVGPNETINELAFGPAVVPEQLLGSVTACPDGARPDPENGCTGQLIPSPDRAILAPCSAAGAAVCPTRTRTLIDTGDARPVAVAAVKPPTWATRFRASGYYVALGNASIWRIGVNGGDQQRVAGEPGDRCSTPAEGCGLDGPAADARLGDPAGLAVGPDGALYVADSRLHRVLRIGPAPWSSAAGEQRPVISTVAGNGSTNVDPGPALATNTGLEGPYGVWVDPTGDVFVADGTDGIREVGRDGVMTPRNDDLGAGTNLRSVVGGADGDIYATGNDRLFEFGPATGVTGAPKVVAGGCRSDGPQAETVCLDHPTGLSMRPNGNVVFADSGNGLIRAYVPKSKRVIELGGVLSGDGTPKIGFNGDGSYADQTELDNPQSVVATLDGLFVVADSANHRVRVIGPPPDDEASSVP